MGRQAQIWKDQGNLTDLGLVTEKLKVEDQLRVRLALRVMRKAHTHGTRADREKERIEKIRRKTIDSTFNLHRKAPGAEDDVPRSQCDENTELLGSAHNRQSLYVEHEPIKMRSIAQIKKEAQASFQLTRDRLRLQNESKKFGKLRPICEDVILECKVLEEKRRSDARMRREKAIESNKPAWSPAPNLLGASVQSESTLSSQENESQRSERLFRVIRRHDLLPTKTVTPFTIHTLQSRSDTVAAAEKENAAEEDHEAREEKDPAHHDHKTIDEEEDESEHDSEEDEDEEEEKKQERAELDAFPWSHSAHSAHSQSTESIVVRAQVASLMWQQQLDRPHTTHTYCGGLAFSRDEDDDRPPLSRANSGSVHRPSHRQPHALGLLPHQTSFQGTSSFGGKTINHDEKILKALRAKEERLHEREERILKKIHDKEVHAQQRQQQQIIAERTKVWMSLVAFSLRMKTFMKLIEQHRFERQWGGKNTDGRKAIAKIKRWWKKMQVVLRLRRNPQAYFLLRRHILMFNVRLRLRRKRRAVAMIAHFLDDCSGLSETMRKMYSFRQSVIKMQRWFRSWNDVQIFRVHLLWRLAEKKSKEFARAERIAKFKNEKSAIKAMSKMQGFSDAMMSINRCRRELSRALEFQEEEGTKRRLDLLDQIQALDIFKKKHEEEVQQRLNMASNLPSVVVQSQSVNCPAPSSAPQRRQSCWASTSSNNLLTVPATPTLTRHNQNLYYSRRGGGDLMHNTNYIFLGMMDRYGLDKSLEYWMKKVRASPATMRTYELLRSLLQQQRKAHILDLHARHNRRIVCPVEMADLKKFLRDPKDNSMSQTISHIIGDMNATSVLAADIINSPFLLLTQGGLEAVDVLIRNNRGLKFY